jgi:hypothetical protein
MKNTIKGFAGIVCLSAALISTSSFADTPINGTVESRCIIQTDRAGTYANPNAYTLTTSPTDGGEEARIRVDVTLADAYYVEITPPSEFSSSRNLGWRYTSRYSFRCNRYGFI